MILSSVYDQEKGRTLWCNVIQDGFLGVVLEFFI